MTSFLPERRRYIPLLSLIAALLNLRYFLAGADLAFSFPSFLTVCFVLAAYGVLYSGLFWGLSALSPRLPLAVALSYALAAAGRGPEGLSTLMEGGALSVLLTLAVLGLVLVLALSSTLADPLTRLRLPGNLLWPFVLLAAAYAFTGLTILRDAHWAVGAAFHLPMLAGFAFLLFISERLHIPPAMNWAGLAVAILLSIGGMVPHIPLEPPPMEGKGQNFLMITVEGLRHDALEPGAMPETAAFAGDGFLFTGMYGTSPAAPDNLKALFARTREGAPVTLVQLFPDRFVRTALLPSSREGALAPVLGGFGTVKVQGRRSLPERMIRAWIPVALAVPPARAPREEEAAAECREILESSSRPFFVWMHLDFAARAVPAGMVQRARAGGAVAPAELRAAYDASLRRLDRALGGLLRWVKGRPWADRTNILLLGVSGMELGEHGSAGAGHAFYEESIRFPFLWAGPSVPGGSAATSMSIQDLFPTLAKAFNLADKPKAFAGMDIASAFRGVFPADRVFPISGNEAYAPARAVVSGGFKLVQLPRGGFMLFDLAGDPLERNDLACVQTERVDTMKGQLP